MAQRQWGGRFEGKTDELMTRLGESVSFDARLAPWDIRASIAHARMLGDKGIISRTDSREIIRGLKQIEKDVAAGNMDWDPELEDVHTNIEAALTARIGDAAKRLHTARSRNDQIATDMRLWARDRIDETVSSLRELQGALVDLAERYRDVIMPGFTHLQHAQPVLFAHHMLAYFEMFQRDKQRMADVRKRVNVLPLGAAALAGTPHSIDRRQVAKELGFDRISSNSMDAVSDRDFLIEFCSAAAIAMMHLSRLCEELVLWSAPEFSFIEIGDAFTTGSSIMPQKKNPDAAELVRGKTGRAYGDLMSLLTLMKGLPLTYNRDMQEDKLPAFDASDTLLLSLASVTGMLETIEVREDIMSEAAQKGFPEATDLADDLVKKGIPFRDAHVLVGRIVLYCIQESKKLGELTPDELERLTPDLDASVAPGLDVDKVVRRRDVSGGTAPRRVRASLKRARRTLERDER